MTLQLTELNPDPADWTRAEEILAALLAEHRALYGPTNPITLTAAIAHGQSLLALGRPRPARSELNAVRDRLRDHLGEQHPLWLRATVLLGQAAAQLHEYDAALRLHRAAFAGQVAALGPLHPDTLKSQFGLGVALLLTGQRREGLAAVAEVRSLAPRSVGYGTDLYAQSIAATALALLPAWLWRLVDRRTSRQDPRPRD